MAAKPKPLPIHHLCELFPQIEGDEYQSLVDDIRERGQEDLITVFKGQVIDGKNRQRAVIEAGREPQYVEWHSPKKCEDVDAAILAFVLTKNLRRRHFNESQRSLLAARIANIHGPGRPDLIVPPVTNSQEISQEAAAKRLDVSRRSVSRAVKVLDAGSTSLIEAVQSGSVSVKDAAKIVNLPKSEQTAAVNAVRSGKAKTVAAASKPKLDAEAKSAAKESKRVATQAKREAAKLARDEEKAQKAAAREAERARKAQEKADAKAAKESTRKARGTPTGGTAFNVDELGDEPTDKKDSVGNPISSGSAEVFSHCRTFRSIVHRLGAIVSEVDELCKTSASRHLRYDDFQTAIKQAQAVLRFAMPYSQLPPPASAKDDKQKKRWKEVGYLIELEHRQLTDKQKSCLTST